MDFRSLVLLAVGLSMDAFAIAVCKGLAQTKVTLRHSLLAGVWFGGFQALMPLIGYLLGSRLASYITAIDHWIAFLLLASIGLDMIREAFAREDTEADPNMNFRPMLLLAISTSIDAFAVGVTLAFLDVQILPAVSFIGCTTFLLSAIGIRIGAAFGAKYKSKAEFVGGLILILLGLKILLEHLGVL